jgi:DNA-binding Xre family transcriptional regulator
MAGKHLSKMGQLMVLLGISITELAEAVKIERTSISRLKNGYKKTTVNMPYFDEIVDYLAQKNRNAILEDYFETIYPSRERSEPDYLKKCIRSFLLNISDKQQAGGLVPPNTEGYTANHTSFLGVEGRRKALLTLFAQAEQLPSPSTITFLELDGLVWVVSDMQYSNTFFHTLNELLKRGHLVELIFSVYEPANYQVHRLMLTLHLHENLRIYLLPAQFKNHPAMSQYVLAKQLLVMSHSLSPQSSISFLFRDQLFIEAQLYYLHRIRAMASPNISDPNRVFEIISSTKHRSEACYYSGKALSIVTMSDELLLEILRDNQVSEKQKRYCLECCQLMRTHLEQGAKHSYGGFYYRLDDITAPLAYESIIHYSLSCLLNRVITMTHEQYLRHFRDTAKFLRHDPRYRVILHYSPISDLDLLWYKEDNWALIMGVEERSGLGKFKFCDNVNSVKIFTAGFHDVYEKVPEYKKENAYVAELFEKISRKEPYA